jgi:hypothetical protein
MAQVEELKSIVLQTLDGKGVLAKLRAQLRQHVYEAIAEVPQEDSAARERLSSQENQLLLGVLADFLKVNDLDHTLSVLCVESGYSKAKVNGPGFRADLEAQLSPSASGPAQADEPVLKAWLDANRGQARGAGPTNPQSGSRPASANLGVSEPAAGEESSRYRDLNVERVSLGDTVSLGEPASTGPKEEDSRAAATMQQKPSLHLGDLPSLSGPKPKGGLLGELPPVSSGPGRRNKPASPESGPPDALSALTGVKSAPPGGLAPLSKTEKRGLLGDAPKEDDAQKLSELDQQLQKIESHDTTAGRSDALQEAVKGREEPVDEVDEEIASESFEEASDSGISGGGSSKSAGQMDASVDLDSKLEESMGQVLGRDVSVDSTDQSLDHAEPIER